MKTKKDFLDTKQLVRSHGYLFFMYLTESYYILYLGKIRGTVYIYTSICHLDFNSL